VSRQKGQHNCRYGRNDAKLHGLLLAWLAGWRKVNG
jgi:hypothetical protein